MLSTTVRIVTTIAVVNQKGGVGKTTAALGLASVAWTRQAPCLVVDIDPQGNATTGLGVWEPTRTVDEALESDQPGIISELAVPSAWPDNKGTLPLIVPSTPLLAARERHLLADPIGAQDRLRVALSGLHVPLVIIDCPPSLGLLTINALFAADSALIVTEPSAWSADGVSEILRTIERIAARKPSGIEIAGVVVNGLSRTRDARYWHERLQAEYDNLVLPPIRLRAALAESAAASQPIHSLASRSGAADACADLEQLYDLVVNTQEAADGT